MRILTLMRTPWAAGQRGPEFQGSFWVAPAVVFIALSAAFLGGDGSQYGEAIPVIGIGLLFWFRPLKAIPAGPVLIGIIGVILCGLIGFLPARWLGEPAWHSAIRHAIPGLSTSVSLQPVHGLLRFCVMLSAISFAVWVLQWQEYRWIWGIQVLCFGVAMVAGIALAVNFLSISVPGWHASQGFGPFPNRNQSATLMGLGATLASGLFVTSLRRRQWQGLFWVLPLALCFIALILSNSRTPLCLFAGGIFLWLFLRTESIWKRLAVAAGAALLVCSATLIIGGTVASRLQDLWAHGLGFRGAIYEDALRLASSSPVTGTGIGNFQEIFPQYRQFSLNSERIVHPESDWLWMAAEMGWGSILFCAIAIVGTFIQRIQIKSRRENGLRLVGLIALGAFLINSIVDVPGHRLGTVLPIFVLAALCTRVRLIGEGSKILVWASRLFAVGAVALAVILIRDAALEQRIQSAVAAADWHDAQRASAEALTRKPLRWSLYLTSGYANVHLRNWMQAIRDFHHADFLEPKLAFVPFSAGIAWVGENRVLAIPEWKEALKRSQPAERRSLYIQMLSASAYDPELHQATIRLAGGSPSLAVLALDPANVETRTLDFLESERAKLTPDEVLALARAEASKAAIEHDYEKAYTIARGVMRPLAFPKRSAQMESPCRDALSLNPQDYAAAFNLCSLLEDGRRWNDMLEILEPLTQNPNCPAYFLAMKAEAYAGANRWSDAWNVAGGLMR
jgi:O-antigen ligase